MKYVELEPKHSKCAYRALTISGLSFVAAILNTIILPFILSPIAIILSHLSKGRLKEKHISAQAATVIAILSLILHIVLLGMKFFTFYQNGILMDDLNSATQTLYNETFEEYTNDILEELGIQGFRFDF